MPIRYLVCENCKQTVARFNTDELGERVESGIFTSHLADRGVAPPWQHAVEARWMKCPLCPKRVFNDPHPSHLTVCDDIEGLATYQLPLAPPEPEDPEPIICPGCGKTYKSQQAYDRYHKCKGDPLNGRDKHADD